MENTVKDLLGVMLFLSVLSGSPVAAVADENNEMWKDKKYVYVSANNRIANDKSDIESTVGIGVGFGYFIDKWSIETIVHAEVARDSDDAKQEAKINGVAMHVLKFPFEGIPGLFGLIGLGISEYSDFPTASNDDDYLVTSFKLGGGYTHRMVIRDFEFGIRFDATYIYGTREERLNAQRNDINSPHFYRDMNYSLGLVIPM